MNISLEKTAFESAVKKALRKGFAATFQEITNDEAYDAAVEIADAFAEACAPDLADAIEDFIKSGAVGYDGSAVTQTFTVVGVCPAGAVSGTATGVVSQPYKMT